jgi:KDO2-lipid IV(A) lauroyltransferase
MPWQRLRHRFEYFVFLAIVSVLQWLSVRQMRNLARVSAWVMVELAPRKLTRYDVAAENIRRAFSEEQSDAQVRGLILRMWEHLFRMVIETVQSPRKLALTNCRDCIVFRDRKSVIRQLCGDRPVFILGGHFGVWEMTQATFGFFGFPMGIIAREMDNPFLHEWFARGREAFGHRLYLKKGNFEGITDLLAAGGNLMLLGDQDAGIRGLFVDFFGTPASTFKSIALMALEYRAIIVVGYGVRLPDDDLEGRWSRFEIGCEEIIDVEQLESDDEVREITERYTQALERAIRRAPEQYFWIHRRWKSQPGVKRKRKARRAA